MKIKNILAMLYYMGFFTASFAIVVVVIHKINDSHPGIPFYASASEADFAVLGLFSLLLIFSLLRMMAQIMYSDVSMEEDLIEKTDEEVDKIKHGKK